MNDSLNEQAERLVRQNVHYCVSGLMSTLAGGGGGRQAIEDLERLCDQASELCSPVQDWEKSARSEGYEPRDGKWFSATRTPVWAASAQDVCETLGVDPYEWEIYEHWIVSDWLAERLAAHGERVDRDLAGLTVWGRTTTGMAIAMDGVILEITREFHKVAT